MKDVLCAILPIGAAILTKDISVAYIGVGLNVMVACSAGTYAAFSFSKGNETRSQLFGLFIACVIMGCALTAISFEVIQYFQPKMVFSEGFKVAVGTIVSFIGRFFLPWLAEVARSGSWLDRVPFLQKKDKE